MNEHGDLPELTPEQRAALPVDQIAAYEQLQAMEPEERVRFAGHIKLARAAHNFMDSVCDRGDLKSVWADVDPDFRLAMAQQWILDNAAQFDADGFDREEVAAALSYEDPQHPLWMYFEEVHVHSFRSALPAERGIGSATRLVSPNAELLYVHDEAGRAEEDTWMPGEERQVFPIVMRYDGTDWRIANLGSETLPVPGWPPSR